MANGIPLAKKRFATFISAYAPTLDAELNIKEHFNRTLYAAIQKIRATDKLLIMGDFNAKVGTEHHVWNKIIGKNEQRWAPASLPLCGTSTGHHKHCLPDERHAQNHLATP